MKIVYEPKINAFMERVGNKNYVMADGMTFDNLKAQINSFLDGQGVDKDNNQESIMEMKKLAKHNARLAIDLLNS